MKRTASGLAKVMSGTFEDEAGSQHQPVSVDGRSLGKSNMVQITQHDFIDENDFDSDIELDVEEPPKSEGIEYPSLPQEHSFALPSKPIVYPTLARQQQAQTAFSGDIDSGCGSVEPSVAGLPPESSAPLPWSSSPLEHYSSSTRPFVAKHFTYKPPNITQAVQNGPPPPQAQLQARAQAQTRAKAQAQPAKRRTLPWLNQGDQAENMQDEATHSTAPAKSRFKTKTAIESTPNPRDGKKSMYPWNTTASAVKEHQRKHREENKKAAINIKKNEGSEESIRTAKSSHQRPARVFLSEEQQHVLDLVLEQKKSVFFTGSAGTGKSVLMREIIAALRKKYQREPDRVAVTASTGLAACNVGGVTLHSFAGIGLGKEDTPELVRKIKKNQKAKHRWMRTKVLIVDEVSMVDGELFDKLESIARQIRNNGRPFGGIQLVITGDFFQLPPVPENGRAAKFAFDAATWNTSVEHTIGLHHVFRQKDPSKRLVCQMHMIVTNVSAVFAGMLNEMREGRLQPSSIQAFRSLSRPLSFGDELVATELFPTRNEVESANTTRLKSLQGQESAYEARDGGAIIDKAQRDRLLQNCMAPESISLKKGAQVMLIKNVDESLVNGSLGQVVAFMDERQFDTYTAQDYASQPDGTSPSTSDPSTAAPSGEPTQKKIIDSITTARRWPVVRFMIADGTSRDLLCQPETWKVELPNGEVQASRNQIPLILAWALSIHKAQGQTLERVKVDLGKVFEKGQAYVALSRATNMRGLQVLRFDPKKVVAHERVRTFYGNLQKVELEAKEGKGSGEGVKKRKSSSAAEYYQKRFVEDGWDA